MKPIVLITRRPRRPAILPAGLPVPYEQVLQRELDGLDDEFNTLKFLAQELQVRANSIRSQKAA